MADFSGPHRRLSELGLVSEESDQHQYRVLDITDPQTGAMCLRPEHEVRSMTHPLYKRPLVNPQPAAEQPRLPAGGRRLAALKFNSSAAACR